MVVKTGNGLPRSFLAALTFNAFTDGKKYSIRVCSRALGLRMRIAWYFISLTRTALRSGLSWLNTCQAASESSAGSAGIIT